MSLMLLIGNDVEFLLAYAKKKAGVRSVFIYDKIRMVDVDEIKRLSMSGRNKTIILNGNNVTTLIYDALLKSIEESSASFFICSTKEIPSTILSRGNIIELLEAPESKVQKLVFRGVNRVEADELLSVFGSIYLATDMFELFSKYEGEYYSLFQSIMSHNYFETYVLIKDWSLERLRLIGLIAEIMLNTSVIFGIRRYFIETLGLQKITVPVIEAIRIATKSQRAIIIRASLCAI